MLEVTVTLPTFHPGQVAAYDVTRKNRFTAVRCGRRWGKTDFAKVIACDAIVKGKTVGWFAPNYKIQAEAYFEMARTLEPIMKSSSKIEGVMRTITGGRADFWTMEDGRAGRSRKYHWAFIDEAAFTKDNAMDIWEKSIKPTLLDYTGKCVVMSNANGISPDNFLYQICEDDQKKYGFAQYHAPSAQNPHIPERTRDETVEEHQARRDAIFEELRLQNHPLVYQQEYLAEFVSWDGVAFFSSDKMLVDGKPVPRPALCDAVFAVIDTAVKDRVEHDGTAVSFYAVSRHIGHRIVLLDWDVIQIEGALLEVWLPTVYQKLEALAKACGARGGSLGAFIEDKVSGTILIQQARRRGWVAHSIDSKLTAAGKSERAISVSGYFYQGLFKITQEAFDKVATFRGATRNHWLAQVTGFRVGSKENNDADDLLDTFTYGLAIALGNSEGY